MKAAVIRKFGAPEVLELAEIADPELKDGHVLIKVQAALVNRLDHYIRLGEIVPDLAFPHVLGMDAVGEVAAVGAGVSKFQVGDRVIAMPGYPVDPAEYKVRPAAIARSYGFRGLQLPGSYAQYIVVPEPWVLLDTTGLPPEQIGSLPVPLLTSIKAVQITGEVKSGDCVLVHAGGSATGLMSIQVAKALGAKVATTVRSKESAELARNAGADLIINSSSEDFVQVLKQWTLGRGVDVAIDSLGGSGFAQTIESVKTQGIIVAMGFMAGTEVKFDIRNFFFGQKQIRGCLNADIEDLAAWLEPVKVGKIRAFVDSALPLSQAAEAHRRVATNTARGSVVLMPWL